MKIRKNLAIVLTIAMALAYAGARDTMQIAYAEADTEESIMDVTDEVEATTEISEETDAESPRIGDHIWITDEMVSYWASDKSMVTDLTNVIQYDIYIVGKYDEENWVVHVPVVNEPEKVTLLPVSGYNITVLDHDGYALGDLNRDGLVDVFDIAVMKRWLIEERDFNLDEYSDIDGLMDRSTDRVLADVNSDGEYSVADIICLQQFLLGVRESFRGD